VRSPPQSSLVVHRFPLPATVVVVEVVDVVVVVFLTVVDVVVDDCVVVVVDVVVVVWMVVDDVVDDAVLFSAGFCPVRFEGMHMQPQSMRTATIIPMENLIR